MKRKKFEDELAKEQILIDGKAKDLKDMVQRKHRKEHELKLKEEEIDSHKPFTSFLESIVNDNSAAGGESFGSIEEIIFRYKALKETNKDLVNEKSEISVKNEELTVEDKIKQNKLDKKLFEEQRKLQQVQAENEAINHQVSILEGDFELEIQKKNQNSRDIGQILNSINNIS